MRIISKFRDYYDTAGVHYSAEDRIWRRQSRSERVKVEGEVKRLLDLWNTLPVPPHDFEESYWQADLVLFCGRLYGVMRYRDVSDPSRVFSVEFLEWVLRLGRAQARQRLRQLSVPGRKDRWTHAEDFNEAGWKAWFAAHQGTEFGPELHQRFDTPVIALRGQEIPYWRNPKEVTLEIEPRLETLGFAGAVDPWTAWQEIDMYLGGPLARQEDPDLHIPDAVMRDMKGFDGRSFKTSPGTHPKRKRRKLKKKR